MILCKNCSVRETCFYCQAVGTRTECKSYKPTTNEEWFDGLSTETKARIMHLVYIAGYTDGLNGAETIPLRDVTDWLKQPCKGD